MLIFGHLGFGSKLAGPFRRGLPWAWILLGTLLPDLIDKPLYYAMSWSTGLHGADLGLISCTRTFGHTGLLLVLLGVVAAVTKSKRLAALMLGMATHLALDGVQDAFLPELSSNGPSSTMMAVLFPFYGHFAVMPTTSLGEHVGSTLSRPFTLISEVLGLLILLWDFWINKERRFGFKPFWRKRRFKQNEDLHF